MSINNLSNQNVFLTFHCRWFYKSRVDILWQTQLIKIRPSGYIKNLFISKPFNKICERICFVQNFPGKENLEQMMFSSIMFPSNKLL